MAPSIYEPGKRVRAPGASTALHYTDVSSVEAYAEQQGMGDKLLRCDLSLRPDQQLSWCASAARAGKWFVISEPVVVGTATLREIAQQVLSLPSTSVHEDFILWLVCPEASLSVLPQLFRSFLLSLHAPLGECVRGRLLAAAVEDDNLFQIKERRGDVVCLSPSDRVELFERCRTEVSMMSLIEGDADTSFVPSSYREDRKGLIDVAIAKDWRAAAGLLCDLGARSVALDLNLIGTRRFLPMLEVLLDRQDFPFNALACVDRVATEGNASVMKLLFEGRVDRQFDYDSYPLASAVYSGSADAAQLVIDRMECVGLHPFRDARISLHVLLDLFSAGHDTAEGPQPLTETALWVANRCTDCILEDGALPYRLPPGCITRVGEASESGADTSSQARALLLKLLQIADPSECPEQLLRFFIDHGEDLKEAQECLSLFMDKAGRGDYKGNSDEIRGGILRELMCRGSSHLTLFECALRYTGTDIKIICPDERVRTPLHQCFELPGYPDACQIVLGKDREPNARNGAGLNCLQQCVVDLTHNTLEYLPNLGNYARLFTCAIAAGVDTSVEAPDFATSLFGLCARVELAPLCYELMSPAPHVNLVLACSENLVANLVSYRRQVLAAARPAGAEPFALNDRQEEGKPQIDWDMPLSLLPLTDEAVLCVMSFLPRKDLACGIGFTCNRFYFLSLYDELWVTQQLRWQQDHAARYHRARVCSAKLHHKMHVTEVPQRRWVADAKHAAGERYECVLTGEVITDRPDDYVVPSSVADIA